VATVPRVVRLDGVAPAGQAAAGPGTVTLTLHDAESGGTLLWEETQVVAIDAHGRYTVYLGGSRAEGLPADALTGDATRWLGVQFAGSAAAPRVPLTSVPYALRAADADTLGGLPPTAFLRAPDAGGAAGTADSATAATDRDGTPRVNTGTAGYIGKFVNATDLTSSVVFEAGGRIGIGTGAVTPLDLVHSRFTDAAGVLTGLAVQNMSSSATAYSGMLFYDHTGALRQFQGYNNSTGEYRINNIAPGGSINFMLGGSSKFQVRPDGDVNMAGSLWKGGARFLHTFGTGNTFLGVNAGNVTMTGGDNTASGASALVLNTTGGANTASGAYALYSNTTGNNNTASGVNALALNTTGTSNTASGNNALYSNTAGDRNTASGASALLSNSTGSNNTALGFGADVSSGNLQNATAIGASALVNASNKIRLGNASVTVIEGQVAYTFASDKTKKEHVQPVDAEGVLQKLRQVGVTSWNYIGQDATAFRHYGPMAQDFYAAFGHDGVGRVGTPTTINSGDEAGILMLAVQALETRTTEQQARETHLGQLLQTQQQRIATLEAENAAVRGDLADLRAMVRALATRDR